MMILLLLNCNAQFMYGGEFNFLRSIDSVTREKPPAPLYALDGVLWRESKNIFTVITPSSVKSISFMNDTIARARYGPQARGGVILITTSDHKVRDSLQARDLLAVEGRVGSLPDKKTITDPLSAIEGKHIPQLLPAPLRWDHWLWPWPKHRTFSTGRRYRFIRRQKLHYDWRSIT